MSHLLQNSVVANLTLRNRFRLRPGECELIRAIKNFVNIPAQQDKHSETGSGLTKGSPGL
jgi:hypothetical protein